MKKCKMCGELKVRERNGIAISKWCKECREIKEAERKKKKKLTKTYQKKLYKTLHKKAWKLISDFVRQQEADEFGFNNCYTCEKRMPWKELQCGHFFHGKLDYDLRNLKPQCAGCNMYLSGNLAVYSIKLMRELGVEGMEQLRLDANTKTYTNDEIENIITHYNDLSKRT